MPNRIARRAFLRTATAAAAVSGIVGRGAQAVNGANSRLRIGLVGCGIRGRAVLDALLRAGGDGVAVTALCDVDRRQSAEVMSNLAGQRGLSPEVYQDYRKVIDHKDVDVVVVGTPDHWHAAVMMLACANGKDVYVEKPVSHNVREGRAMVQAVRKYKRIVQAGMQQRSDPHFREAMNYLRTGSPLGIISRTATFNFSNETPDGIGSPSDGEPPVEVDYDLWLGAARQRPFNLNRFHWSWRFFYDYGGGMICDWNVHIHDIVHWGMNVTAPLSIAAFGPTPAHGPLTKGEGYKRALTDNRETPDLMDVVYEYETPEGHRFTQVYTMGKVYHRGGGWVEGYGTEFYGSNGALFINRGGWRVIPEDSTLEVDESRHRNRRVKKGSPRTPAVQKPGNDNTVLHARNFLDCVRSRKTEDLNCDIEVGHRTAIACHLGNVALRVGRKIWWDGEREIALTQDGQPDAEANQLLGREYRKGYELPSV